MAVSYATVCSLVDELVESRGPSLGDDVRIALRHYSQMLRRHIVPDSEIAELCRRIYRKHQRAPDLIFEHRPDQQAAIRDVLVERIQQTNGLLLDRAGKTRIEFVPVAWEMPALRRGEGWTPSGRMLLFQFSNEPKRLGLTLWLGPGPSEIRQRLYERGQLPPFRPTGRKLAAKWNSLWSRAFLQPWAYESEDMPALVTEIDKHWAQFVGHELPALVDAITTEEWLRAGG